MSLILFFGLAIFIFAAGVIYTALVIRHHWKKKSLSPTQKPPQSTSQSN
jgi:hypothetical protein